MTFLDIAILALIAVAVVFALRSWKKSGSCGGDCANCKRSCKKDKY